MSAPPRRPPSPAGRFLRIAGLGLLAGVAAGSTRAAPLTAPTYFDFAPAAAATRSDAIVLTPADRYAAPRGYGWTQPPSGTFGDRSWGGVRSPALCDGVSGPAFTLRLDLAPGRWTALAFLDDGYRDAHIVRILVNGRLHPHNPREFGLEEEPAPPPINRFRVALLAFDSTPGAATEIEFARAALHGARLLDLHLLPVPDAASDAARWFLRQIAEAGRHGSHAPLEALRSELTQHAQEPALAAFGAYWRALLDLLHEAERWHRAGGWDWLSVETRTSMFTRYKVALSLLDALVDHPDGAAFPLRPRALWLRARLLYWIWMEQHLEADHAAFGRDIAALRRDHPDDPLVAMYAGEKIPDAGPAIHAMAGAPDWSTAQCEALQRLRRVAHWWIDHRQIPNGEIGGKPDDDVETLRWWPALMFSGDQKVTAAFARMAEGVWFSRRVHRGYSRDPRDVEHSAEFVADTVPMMAFLARTDEWLDRLAWSHAHMRDLWTGRNAHGDLQFKSAWIGATSILTDPPRNRDLAMNTRAAKAVRWLAWLRAEPAATRLLHDWGRTWARAAARTDKGKPAGLFPASLRWPDAAFNGDEPSWHRANMFWHYFDWRGDGMLYDELLCSWVRTGDDTLLAPLRSTLALLERDTRAAPPPGGPPPPEGSPAWAAALLMRNAGFWGVVAQWRLETADTRFDDFLGRHAPPYLRFRLGGDPQPLVDGIASTLLDHLRYNTPMRTSEVLFTDRIHVTRDVGPVDGVDLLVAMLTGNHAPDGLSPYYHVAWAEAPATFTALVTVAGPREFAAEIFLHQRPSAPLVARLFRLSPGNYRLTCRTPDRVLVERREMVGPNHRVALDVPGGTLVRLHLAAE